MSHGRFLALFLAAATGLRWWWNLARPLSPDEAYLALCGFIPSFAYFDGPGGTPWLVALGVATIRPGGFGATFFWPLLAVLASVAAYLLVSKLAGKHAALAVALLLNLLPVFNHSALHATCAMPLAAAGLVASLCAWNALERSSAAWWTAAGLCAAFGLCFSYTAWFILPALGLVLLVSHRWRTRLASAGFALAWVPPAIVYVLLLRWNHENGWVHFIGGTWRTAVSLDFSRLGPSILEAASALSPLVLIALCFACGAAARNIRISPKIKFISIPALAAFLAVIYASLRDLPSGAAGLLAAALALPLIVWLPARLGRIPSRPILVIVFASAALWCALSLPRPSSAAFVDAGVGQQIEALRRERADAADATPFLVAEDAPLAAALSLALPDPTAAAPGHPPVYTVESAAARSQFDLWPRYDQFVDADQPPTAAGLDPFTEQRGTNPFLGHSALYITTQQPAELPQAVTAAFADVQLLSEVATPDGRLLRVYFCSEYQTMPL